MRRYVAIPVLLIAACLCLSATFAQQGPKDIANEAPPGVDPTLWRVLVFWESHSSKIKRLEGGVVRRTYDIPFKVETMGQGQFFYQSPDNGRLDMNPVPQQKIKALIAKREQPDAPVQRDGNGKPFTLESALAEKWVCDGKQLITVNEDDKSAHIMALPKQLRGQNIMNGPLPFLFGLPPAEALSRFDLKLVKAPTQSKPVAVLTAFPKRQDDQQNWIKATILLNTRTGLPTGIELIAPGKNKRDVYVFADMKVNPVQISRLWGQTPFKLNLREYNVKIVDVDAEAPPQKAAQGKVPNLIGLPYQAAQQQLKAAGLTDEQISLQKGPAARNKADKYKVMDQDPPAGTPIKMVKKQKVTLWT